MGATMRFILGIYTGFKVHAALFAAVLTCLATFAGLVPGQQGHALAMGLIAIATSLRHLSTTSIESRLDQLIRLNGAKEAGPVPSVSWPVSIKFPGVSGLFLLLVSLASVASSQESGRDRPALVQKMDLGPAVRRFYANPDGSCVQCSIGMAGAHCNDLNAASLLWDTSYGAAVRGGSWPSRVERYCADRGIRAWSVTGASVDDTWPWIQWAARTGRFAAIGAGQAHFQTLYGYDPRERVWLVCNNNSTDRVDRYTDGQLRELHRASGPWVVILEKPSSVAPVLVNWLQR